MKTQLVVNVLGMVADRLKNDKVNGENDRLNLATALILLKKIIPEYFKCKKHLTKGES